jgi:hypothetical protein
MLLRSAVNAILFPGGSRGVSPPPGVIRLSKQANKASLERLVGPLFLGEGKRPCNNTDNGVGRHERTESKASR